VRPDISTGEEKEKQTHDILFESSSKKKRENVTGREIYEGNVGNK